MVRSKACHGKCIASMLLCLFLLTGMLLSGCRNIEGTDTDEEAASKAETSVASSATFATDKNGNTVTETTVPDASGNVEKGKTRKAEASATTTEKAGSMKLKVGNKTFVVQLENNVTANALKAQLPLDLAMTELNGNEKYYYYSSLPSNATRPGTVHAGDVMLYQENTLVIFYKTFQTEYSYTRIGTIQNPEGLAKALGSGDVRVQWTL